MPTSEEQQSQIAELRADFRVLQANFATHEHKFEVHESDTETQLTKYKNWIMGGVIVVVSSFSALAVTIIVTLLLDIF